MPPHGMSPENLRIVGIVVVAIIVAMVVLIKLIEDHFKSPHAHRNVINFCAVIIAGALVYTALDYTGLLPNMPSMPWQHHAHAIVAEKHRAHHTSVAWASQSSRLVTQNEHARHWRVQ